MTLLLCLLALSDVKTREIEYKDGDTVLLGYLAFDDAAKEKRPGVLVIHEWWGHDDYVRSRAEQLARLGYVAFALDMYGKGTLAKTPEDASKLASAFYKDAELGRRRAAAGLEVLRKQEAVDPARLAAIGYCFGGRMALELARSGADLRGVVSFHGSLSTEKPAEAAALKAKVLVCNGGDDAFVSEEEIVGFVDEMRRAKADWQIVHYGGAVHSFTNPAADQRGIKGVKYHPDADRRSWEHMQGFFREVLGG